ncbi:MAG TPA: TIR domain-containing protein [Gemmatimonadales bacterium]|nr:TIR domain-containing protein [Gemmatimonadales bacterium]
MPYQYEIFLSYPRLPMVVKWLDKFFEPLFSQWLREELLAQDPRMKLRIFRDRDIGAGEQWPRIIREAARDSRCAVAILMPSYFASDWCRAEWATFRLRGKEHSRNLLVPVRFHDCLHMSLAEQVFDLSQYTAMAEDTPRWVDFNDQVKDLAAQVAQRVLSAPPYPADPECARWLALEVPDSPSLPPILPSAFDLNDTPED